MARATSVDVLECPPCVIADGPRNLAAAGLVPEETGLVYVSDSEPGIRRQRRGKGFVYRMPDGSIVTDPSIKSRIAALGLPPCL
jgi:DNA topoisomerase-1